jgi:hypothetical protein
MVRSDRFQFILDVIKFRLNVRGLISYFVLKIDQGVVDRVKLRFDAVLLIEARPEA